MAIKKTNYKTLNYYLNLNWTYTIQMEQENNKPYYVICVNELPGICTDAPSMEEAMQAIKEAMIGAFKLYMKHNEEIPEPINEKHYKGNISYRTTSKRHYLLTKEAQKNGISLSQTIDHLIDQALKRNFS